MFKLNTVYYIWAYQAIYGVYTKDITNYHSVYYLNVCKRYQNKSKNKQNLLLQFRMLSDDNHKVFGYII